MILRITLILLYALNTGCGERRATLRVDQRVKLLKQQLERDLRSRHIEETGLLELEPIEDHVGLVDEGDGDLVAPILDYGHQKKNKLKRKVNPSTGTTANTPTSKTSTTKLIAKAKVSPNVLRQPATKHYKKEAKAQKQKALAPKQPVSKRVDIFYRKAFYNNIDLDATVPFVHCAAMVSPYFSGTKKQLAMMKVVTKSDHTVLRLIQLLNINTTDFVRDEVYSVLYQISQLKIRIWGWDLTAMNMLFNVITREKEKDRVANFKSLKAGLKRMFDGWKLDRRNVSRLLMQARVFRPPCLMHSHTGSSRFVPGSTVPSKVNLVVKTESGECDSQVYDCSNRKSFRP